MTAMGTQKILWNFEKFGTIKARTKKARTKNKQKTQKWKFFEKLFQNREKMLLPIMFKMSTIYLKAFFVSPN